MAVQKFRLRGSVRHGKNQQIFQRVPKNHAHAVCRKKIVNGERIISYNRKVLREKFEPQTNNITIVMIFMFVMFQLL